MSTYWSAITAAQAAVDLDDTMFDMLHTGVGWRFIAPAVRDLARVIVLRLADMNDERGLRLLQTVDSKRIRDLSSLASQAFGLDHDELSSTTVKLASKIMRGSVRQPFAHPFLKRPHDERIITASLCIVALMIIGIDANCRRKSGEVEASIWTVIDGLRSHPVSVG